MGQQKLYVGQTIRCEFFGQDLAAAGVAVRSAAVPTAAAKTIPRNKLFLRMVGSPRELEGIVASGAPDRPGGHEEERNRPRLNPILTAPRLRPGPSRLVRRERRR